MQSLNWYKPSASSSPDISRMKVLYGAIYGLVAGMSFAIATWGWDSYLLSQSHVAFPWLKLIVGTLACGLGGGIAGWIAARFGRWYLVLPAWVGLTALFAWLTVALPLQIVSIGTAWFEPELQKYIHYSSLDELAPQFWVAFAWILIFALITSVLQTASVDAAVFSASIFGKISPFLLSAVIFVICGVIADNMNNELLRRSVMAMDSAIQFVVDNQGKKADPTLSRAYHAGSLLAIRDQVTPERKLMIRDYGSYLSDVRVIVKFDGFLANCDIINEQPSNCTPLQDQP